MHIFSGKRPGQFIVLTALVFSIGLATVASGGQGANGNGKSGSNGRSESRASSGGNSGNSNRGGNAANAQAGQRLPAKLDAYKAAYVATKALESEAERLGRQLTAISAMSEADFNATYPNGDYAATLQNIQTLCSRAQSDLDRANADLARLLLAATDGRPLDEAGRAQLHRLLGISS